MFPHAGNPPSMVSLSTLILLVISRPLQKKESPPFSQLEFEFFSTVGHFHFGLFYCGVFYCGLFHFGLVYFATPTLAIPILALSRLASTLAISTPATSTLVVALLVTSTVASFLYLFYFSLFHFGLLYIGRAIWSLHVKATISLRSKGKETFISKFQSCTEAIDKTWDFLCGTRVWIQEGSIENQENHIMKSLHHNIEVPCLLQLELLWHSVPSHLTEVLIKT